MEAQLHFAFDKSDLTDSAKVLLDEKVAVFRANPSMTIVLLGYTDVTGTDAYNMALGTRRAQATKDYIVARGIAPSRIIIESKGEGQQIPMSGGVAGEASNRRAVFRLLIAPDAITKP
jgi:outer membrane protein OmpA-like peptidoglycan-associated protein